MDLTEKQRETLEGVHRLSVRNQYPPTVRELGEELGLSAVSSVQTRIEQLISKGLLVRRDYGSRTLVLSDEGLAVVWGRNPVVTERRGPVMAKDRVRAALVRRLRDKLGLSETKADLAAVVVYEWLDDVYRRSA